MENTESPQQIEPPETPEPSPFHQIILDSQAEWREAPRGILSRPQELPKVSQLVDRTAKRIFPQISADTPPVLVAWSVLKDWPQEPIGYRNQLVYPEGLDKKKQEHYRQSIYELNEWATNLASRKFLRELSNIPAYRPLGNAYGRVIDTMLAVNFAGTYRQMRRIRKMSGLPQHDFEQAVFSAYFSHDHSRINEIIKESTTTGSNNLEELALELGNKSSWFGNHLKLYNKSNRGLDRLFPNNPKAKELIERLILSVSLGGVNSQPGVAEVIASMQLSSIFGVKGAPLASAEAAKITQAIPLVGELITKNLIITGTGTSVLAPALITAITSMTGYFISHESMHVYSASENFSGLRPIEREKKIASTTPYKIGYSHARR